jgi:predicted metal-dependent phosphotriesterase family hydrolase
MATSMTERIGETHDYGFAPGERFEPVEIEVAFDLSQPHIMTALGPIKPDEFGFALHHEHVIANPVAANDPDLVLDDPEASLAELELFHAAGGRGLVDMSTADYGRDILAMAQIAAHSPVHLVIATGHHKDLYAAPYAGDESINQIAARNVRELTEGIDGTAIRAGVIKAGTSLDEITPVEERVLRAASRAHLATGAPISTHTERGTMAIEQTGIFKEEGVDPSRVIIGHMDHRLDGSYLKALLDTGVFVSFDQISKTQYGSDESRAAMVKTLVDSGYTSQILLSGDLARKSKLRAYGGEPGLTNLIDNFPLILMDAGLDAQTVRELFVENPARALTIR